MLSAENDSAQERLLFPDVVQRIVNFTVQGHAGPLRQALRALSKLQGLELMLEKIHRGQWCVGRQ